MEYKEELKHFQQREELDPRRISEIEEHKGDDEYLSILYSTDNSFILSWPAIGRSLTIDKQSEKMTEHDLYLET